MKNAQDTYTLSNGVKIPCIGFGTWTLTDHDICVAAVEAALQAGYRHIDTAQAYQNESFVGEAITKSDIAREDLFITSKLWNKIRGYDETIMAIEESLKKLNTDYLDLFLIHWPNPVDFRNDWKQMNAESYRAMEDMCNQGKIRALGISNFRKHHIDALMETASIQPVVNQIEVHPSLLQDEIISFCQTKGIFIEAYSPLGSSKLLDKLELKDIANKYGKSVAQIILRWHIQKGYLPLPRSTNAKRIKENSEIFDFNLSDEDIAIMDNLDYEGLNSDHDPDTATF